MNETKGIGFVFVTALISGISIFMNKLGLVKFPDPFIFATLKNFIVVLFLFSTIIIFREKKKILCLSRGDLAYLIAIGALGGGIPFLLFFKGLTLTSAAMASFIHKTMFVFVSCIAFFVLRERLSRIHVLATALLLVGSALILNVRFVNFGVGETLVFSAMLFWSIETIISKKALRRIDPDIVALGRMFFGSMILLSFLVFTDRTHILTTLTPKHLGWLLLTSIFLYGYVRTWYSGLKHINASTAASILLLGSPVTTLLSFLFLSEVITPVTLVGIALISIGVLLFIGLSQARDIVKHLVPGIV